MTNDEKQIQLSEEQTQESEIELNEEELEHVSGGTANITLLGNFTKIEIEGIMPTDQKGLNFHK